MKLTEFETRPFQHLDYLNARARGGVERVRLPFLRGRVDALPAGLDALVLTADLQGHELGGDGRLLLGVLLDQPALIVLHDGPDHPTARGYRGQPGIRDVLADAERPTLVVRGHKPWPEPWFALDHNVGVVNVHERVLVLTA